MHPTFTKPLNLTPESFNKAIRGATKTIPAKAGFRMSHHIFQIVTLLLFAITFGSIAQKLGQPKVVGELLAGIMLSPTISGKLLPGFYNWAWSNPSQDAIQVITTIALILIIVELPRSLRPSDGVNSIKSKAFFTAVLGVAISIFVGGTIAYWAKDDLSPCQQVIPYLIYCGIALSASAIPVLMQLVRYRPNLTPSCSRLALTVAIYTDAITWIGILIFFSVYSVRSLSLYQVGITALSLTAYAVALIAVSETLRACRIFESPIPGDDTKCGIALCFILSSALLTDHMGLHYISGAFLAALVLQERPGFFIIWNTWIGRFGDTILTPLFFAFCGSQVAIDLDNLSLLAWGAAFALALIASKLIAALLIGKAFETPAHTSIVSGLLSSSKGIMDILILQIGIEARIISTETYQALLATAIITTLLINPFISLWEFIYYRYTGPLTKPATD